MLSSLFQTLCLWGQNPRLWLTAYLSGCAEAGGRAPEDGERCQPWNPAAEQRRAWGGDEEADVAESELIERTTPGLRAFAALVGSSHEGPEGYLR